MLHVRARMRDMAHAMRYKYNTVDFLTFLFSVQCPVAVRAVAGSAAVSRVREREKLRTYTRERLEYTYL